MKGSKIEILQQTILEKNVTFLFGAGASAPFFSSLGNFERILENEKMNDLGKKLVKILFYKVSISDNSYLAQYINHQEFKDKRKGEMMLDILNDYTNFIHNVVEYIKTRNSKIAPKRVNIVTTNYDLFLEVAMETYLEHNPRIFFNDGANGYIKRILSTDNYNKTLLYSGLFDNYSTEMPVVNLIKCHGSINWKEYKNPNSSDSRTKIQVLSSFNFVEEINNLLDEFWKELNSNINRITTYENTDSLIDALNNDEVDYEGIIIDINELANSFKNKINELITKIDQLQIVFPTKKKFETTLINENYFNMLRLLSYELEKDQSALIVFGFSFNDEHIADIVQRSLNNDGLIVIVICYSNHDEKEITSRFNFTNEPTPHNIIFITPDDLFEEEIDKKAYEEDRSKYKNYNPIEFGEKIKLYKKQVDIQSSEDKMFPVLSFSSFNSFLREVLENNYNNLLLNKEADKDE